MNNNQMFLVIDSGLQGMSGNNAAAAAAMQFNPYFMYQLQMAQALGKKSCK